LFGNVYIQTAPLTTLTASIIKNTSDGGVSSEYVSSYLNELFGNWYYFEDSADIVFSSLDLFYRRNQITQDIALGADIGTFYIEKRGVKRYNGIRYGATLFYKNFSFRLGINDYDDFKEVVPTIEYSGTYKQHNYLLSYTRQNALFYTYSLCPYEKRITDDHIMMSDYISYKDKTDLWAAAGLDMYSNSDTQMTAQFDWRFSYNDTSYEKLHYYLALEGWYTTHSKSNDCFYSPNFDDSTILRIDPWYDFSKYLSIRGKLGLGYSFNSNSALYKYGLWLYGNPKDNLSYSIGCLQSNSTRSGIGSDYYYNECNANLGYKW